MKKILLATACVFAMSATAMAQSSMDRSSSGTAIHKNDAVKKNTMKPVDPNAATTGSSMDSKRGVPGNNTVGGDGSQSNPKSTAPGAAKAGGG
ncbi:probable glycin-rich signal peptide protein [Afipia carboxidovorans OM5]|uniref:Uncharacterized protein n=1 Tax=Afipia carboxidovorans (strain ATCC 49405 / DSM 1227 / KCTC 32145 / OM5) TaxID=504832 RepID=B6JF65_AFIC5|nr:hypothetical protein [Afipia carboxidovorans]ACI92879.1 probable glycin-rich signal peptide protein [Afipia carboxidovorans OM5]AEI03380.1 hypothetical protein OCA4_c22540 [Afipia carboxidovorans OM4]AEI06957.1 hypothetical protein OCA5_c22550 [Afipia carboxidovorans OM5]BEV44269.1 hypothetical protein CRBSH125_04520 [Afipia carboxidovorans]